MVINIQDNKMILNSKYQISDLFKSFKPILNSIYNDEKIDNILYCGNLENKIIINKRERKDRNFINKCRDKTGVYIFSNNKTPVYIGENSKTNTEYCLFKRISQHLSKNDNASFIKNIKDTEDQVAYMEKLELTIILLGDKDNEKANKQAKVLESLLIYLFQPKYNIK